MSSSLATTANGSETLTPDAVKVIETVITTGDLSTLSPQQRVNYYVETCGTLGLEWRTKPFDVVRLRNGGPMILYPNKGCAEQLARKYQVSAESVRTEETRGVYVEWIKACTPSGRCVTKKGAVPIGNAQGDALANAMMKAETKGFRRAVLALIGLNMTDESELDTIPGAQRVRFDAESGTLSEPERPAQARESRPATRVSVGVIRPAPDPEAIDASTGEIETAASVKHEIQALAKEYELTGDDLKTVASDLNLPPWVKLDLGQAQVLRNELIDRINDARREEEADEDEDAFEQGRIIDAETAPVQRDWTD